MAAGKSKSGSMFDPEALMEAHKRNFQALADAGNIVAEGMRSYAERQVAMARESMSQLWNELQSVGKRAPAAPTDQLERMRTTFEKVVAQVQELGQHMLDVQTQALAVLNECATRNLEVLGQAAPELAELQQKAKHAFEQASQQTSVVIDEMKTPRRLARGRRKARRAPARAPKPAPAAPAARPPPSRPPRATQGARREAPATRVDRRQAEGELTPVRRSVAASQASITRPAAIRYQPNGTKVCRPRKVTNARTTTIAVTNAAALATAMSRPRTR